MLLTGADGSRGDNGALVTVQSSAAARRQRADRSRGERSYEANDYETTSERTLRAVTYRYETTSERTLHAVTYRYETTSVRTLHAVTYRYETTSERTVLVAESPLLKPWTATILSPGLRAPISIPFFIANCRAAREGRYIPLQPLHSVIYRRGS